ncbi:hypothetical protein CEXT_562981 [Caerostris extrusa]|uniref:Uncharacterized protein n=1 Tax=Caerostris extrusa TaxID=172846 RepID=A0AAV4WRK6_CAEEX|nr:hypothetical protein CEXT_562981 [Caerostris extrusa]
MNESTLTNRPPDLEGPDASGDRSLNKKQNTRNKKLTIPFFRSRCPNPLQNRGRPRDLRLTRNRALISRPKTKRSFVCKRASSPPFPEEGIFISISPHVGSRKEEKVFHDRK